MKKILVTGASGWLGTAIVKALLARGDAVIGTDIVISPATTALATRYPALTAVAADLCEWPQVLRLLNDHRPDAVIHAAAIVGVVQCADIPVKANRVNVEGSINLFEAMRLAAHRDGIAREYVTTFETTFETGAPTLVRARRDGLTWDDAIVETFLYLLAAAPDTHVARRGGAAAAEAVQQRAVGALAAGGVRSPEGTRAIEEMDRALRDARNVANPGTTADLTGAAIFAVLLGGGWP